MMTTIAETALASTWLSLGGESTDLHPGPSHRARVPDLLALVAYLSFVGWQLAGHVMWRDELQSWDLARSSGSLGQLLGRVRYEQHPPGWYVLLWLWSRLSGDPRMLQVLMFVLVAVTGAFVLRYAPWPWPVRWLLLAGYFPLFEWSTISRPYLLDFLLAVLSAELVRRRGPAPALGAVLAGMILIDDAFGLAVAIALLGAVAVGGPGRWRRLRIPAAAAGLAAVVAVALSSAPANYGGPRLSLAGAQARAGVGGIAQALLPMPEIRTTFWDTFAIDRLGAALPLLGLVAVVVVARLLRRDPRAMVLWVVGSTAVIAVVAVTDRTSARFIGTTVIVVICAFWIHGPPAAPVDRRRLLAGLVALLALQVPAAVVAIAETTSHPFSEAQAAGRYVAGLHGTVVASYDAAAVPVAAYAGRPLDMADGLGHPSDYVVWNEARSCDGQECPFPYLVARALTEARRVAAFGPVYVLTDTPARSPHLRLLRSWAHGVADDEDFWVYAYTT